ncbi:hypothetical protein BH09PAT1_BH09PAT1_7750 [soil metagenome]
MTQLSLIPLSPLEEEKNRTLLLASIKRKRTLLQKLVVRGEMLKVRLDMLKGEYTVKIGSLVLKDNHMDLEIINMRNLLHLMREGKTYDEAVVELSTTFFAEQLEMEKEEEKIRIEKETFDKRQEQESSELLIEAKKLWKRLIGLFHPDLTQDPNEKKRREEIMKQINQAYEEGDYSKLTRIEREQTVINDSTLENLEEMLIQIENEILQQEKLYQELKESEWYRWDQKISRAKKTLDDIFRDVEKKLIDDILAKIEIIKSLTKDIDLLKENPSNIT